MRYNVKTLMEKKKILQYKSFENTVGKGEIACNEQFLLFPQCFLPTLRPFFNFQQCFLKPFTSSLCEQDCLVGVTSIVYLSLTKCLLSSLSRNPHFK